ncbi:sulfurtransferase TusA family protein [Halobaculum litoreum]|uniref:sulfurtransferase TusA family protein n=1 Tax=Halobaculum litoreum TaxID=3031998 RepID=UPI0024C3AB4C|nr:sulfurtransferase TusA family protein [Halobaculum sp. DT92]
MNAEYDIAETLDVKGASCPMPVIETKQATDDLAAGEVLEVLATDSGSVSDIAGWADGTPGVELLDQTDDGDVFAHYVRKTE